VLKEGGLCVHDCRSGAVDAILHMGDHAYDLGFSGDRRGDAYMNSLQPLLARCPWYPVVGNHEASDGDHYNRYMKIAWGEVFGSDPDAEQHWKQPPHTSTATTALGHLLTKGTMYASVHNAVPSNTSRYTATDYGLVHVIGLDLMNFDVGQAAWLEADLKAAAANRANVPWIMASAHVPIYHATMAQNSDKSAAHFLGEEGEAEVVGQPLPPPAVPNATLRSAQGAIFSSGPMTWRSPSIDGHAFVECEGEGCLTIGQWQAMVSAKLEPLLLKYGVDIMNAGHVHDYCATWPMVNNVATQKNYINPTGIVHITEGNGGVPGVVGTYNLNGCSKEADWCRMHGVGGAYGRMIFWNATHATYEHVQNNGGEITDAFTIVQAKHGGFTAPCTATA